MPEGPFPDRGPDGQEPDGSQPQPADRNGPENRGPTPSGDQDSDATLSATPPEEHDAPPEEPTQGLFICLPAEQADLSGFADGSSTHPIAPGPLLAEVVSAVAGGGGAGLAQISEDCLFSVLSAGRRMSSWGTWLELAAMRELAVRHPYTPDRRASRGRTPKTSGTPAQDPPGVQDRPGVQDPPGVQDRPASQDQPAAPDPAGAAQDPAGAAQDPAGAGAGPGGAPVGPNQPADDGRIQFSEFISDEVACELRLTWMAAEDRMSYACDLAGRLPVTFAALGAGLIDPVHAKIIAEQTHFLSAADAAKADPLLAAAAQKKTYAELRAAAAKLVLKLDPEAAERRKQARRKNDAHVRPFREESGNAGMIARELPSDEVLASWQHLEQRARDLRAAGVPGSLRELRVRAYFDLLQERDSRLVAGAAPDQGHNPPDATGSNGVPSDGPDGLEEPEGHEGSEEPEGPEGPDGNGGPQDGSGGNGGNGPGPHRPAGPGAGPCLAALVNLTVPLATALGQSGTPGEAAGFGLLDAGTARDLIAAAGRSPYTRWCVTVLHPDGTAAAHGCAAGRHPPPPGPEPPGPEPPGPEPPGSPSPGGASRAAPPPPGPAPPGTAGLGTSRDTSGSPDPPPQPDTRARDYLSTLRVRLTPIARGSCDHKHAETGYQPSRKLQHLIRTRSTRCTAPGCGRPAARCDLDHTLAWDKGGLTCECGLAPLCRHHHRCKQAQGWQLTQPEPGVLQWRTPHGRTFATTPTEYYQ